MKTLLLVLAVLACAFGPSPAMAGGATESPNMKPLPVGQAFPDIAFAGPLLPGESASLGMKPGAGPFRLGDVKARAVILVVFSMYCPYCQRDAPELLKMHEMIQSRGLSDDMLLIGLGAGNSPFEVNVFREKFGLTFPLIPDQDFVAHKALGQVGTPYYYVLRRDAKGFTIVDGQLGCLASTEAFLDAALATTGLPLRSSKEK